jgi:hypothetical protein
MTALAPLAADWRRVIACTRVIIDGLVPIPEVTLESEQKVKGPPQAHAHIAKKCIFFYR